MENKKTRLYVLRVLCMFIVHGCFEYVFDYDLMFLCKSTSYQLPPTIDPILPVVTLSIIDSARLQGRAPALTNLPPLTYLTA